MVDATTGTLATPFYFYINIYNNESLASAGNDATMAFDSLYVTLSIDSTEQSTDNFTINASYDGTNTPLVERVCSDNVCATTSDDTGATVWTLPADQNDLCTSTEIWTVDDSTAGTSYQQCN